MLPSELLDKPEKWIKYCLARTAGGIPVDPYRPEAVCWCLGGAIERCCPTEVYEIAEKLFPRPKGKGDSWIALVNWNNTPERTYEEVIAKLKECGL